jgi:hypothetical protein
VVPVEVDLDCRYSPPPSNAVTVHMTSAGRSTVQTAKLASTPEAITEKWERVCATPNGRVPRRADLVGIWSVERADFFAGRMLIELRADGTFALDPFTTLFTDPGKYGDYRYRSGRLMLVSRGGQDCPKGDRSLWQVGLLSDGQLRIRILNQYDSVCRAADGEVWIARRVSPPAPSRRRSQ